MEDILDKHRRLIEQIKIYESLVPSSNIEAMNLLSYFKKEIELITSELEHHCEFQEHSLENPLTPREREVLILVAKGEPNKEIAFLLNISPKTVQFHLKSIFNKLDVSSRTEATTKALKLKIISL